MPKLTSALIATAATLLLATPSFAADEAGQKAKPIQRGGKTLYCLKSDLTGSRMPKQTCLTKEEWANRGAAVASAEKAETLASNPQVINQN